MKEPLRILFLEDMPSDVELIQRTLRKEGISFVGRQVDERQDFIDSLYDFHPEIILSDHALPQFNSTEALSLCRQLEHRIPFIIVTGAMTDEFAVSCLKAGADDYVLKSNLTRLPSVIQATLKQHEDEYQRRAAELALRQQNDELVKINSELDRFVYSVSHNLRAPLMSVLGLLNLAKHELQPNASDLKDYLGMMESSIHKLDRTLKEILDYSKNSRQEVDIERIDFREIISECLDNLKYIPAYGRLSRETEVIGIAPFYSNAYRLKVIFHNLLSNAIKFQDQRKPDSFIHIKIQVNPSAAIVIIKDNGIGIPDELQGFIFNMFFRANERSEGSGLGLYIVKEMIGKLEGEISVRSIPGSGSSFELLIPNLMETNKVETKFSGTSEKSDKLISVMKK
jgi:signal transduction histidine kinase